MEQQTSALLQRLSESATIAMARKARELKAQGVDVISLSLGEPDFDTPAEMKQAGIDAIEANETHYTPVPGTPRVRKAIVEKFKRDNGLEYTMDQVVVSTGAKQSLANVVLSLVDPGDEVILPAPYWVSYEEIVKVAGGVPVVLPTSIDHDYKIQPQELEAAITPKTRLVMYSSPCNPSGSVYTEAETAALADVLRQHDRIVTVSDEIYELINFTDKHASMAAQPGMWERTVTVNGISKGFAMTGWRLGYIGAPTWIAAACTKIQGQFTSAPSSITQAAAAAVFKSEPAFAADMVDASADAGRSWSTAEPSSWIQGEPTHGRILCVPRSVIVVWQILQWQHLEQRQRRGLLPAGRSQGGLRERCSFWHPRMHSSVLRCGRRRPEGSCAQD